MKKMFFLFTLFMFLALGSVSAYESYSIGDVITYRNEKYYVIANSDSEQSYVTLLKKNSLSKTVLNNCWHSSDISSNPVIDSNGAPYYYASNCKSDNNTACSSLFSSSSIKVLLDNWIQIKLDINDLEEVEEYNKVRLLKTSDLRNLGYDGAIYGTSVQDFKPTEETPEWLKLSKGNILTYWLINDTGGQLDGNRAYFMKENGDIDYQDYVYNNKAVRPVINLKKDAIISNEQITHDGSFKVGDSVIYNDEYYFVIKNSSSSEDDLYLLKANFLSESDIKKYGNDRIQSNGRTVKYNSNCSESNKQACDIDYKKSDVKVIVDNWAKDIINPSDLIESDINNVRLLNSDELRNIGFETFDNTSKSYSIISENRQLPMLILNGQLKFWTMASVESNYQVYTANKSLASLEDIYSYNYIRPVIHIKKSAADVVGNSNSIMDDNVYVKENGKVCRIEHQTLITYATYNVGEIVKVKGEDYLVIADSKKSQSFVTLLKIDALTSEQLKRYSSNSSYTGGDYGLMTWSDSENTPYDQSYVKKVVDNWIDQSNLKQNLIKDENGHYASLLNIYSYYIQGANHTSGPPSDYDLSIERDEGGYVIDIKFGVETPDWFHSNQYSYWRYDGRVITDESFIGRRDVASVRPVINLSWKYLKDEGYWMDDGVSTGDLDKKIQIGTKVTYNGIKFIVFDAKVTCVAGYDCSINSNDDKFKPFIRLIKETPLTQVEIDEYISENEKTGTIFYSSNECNGNNNSNCKNRYEESGIQTIINNWTNDNFSDDDLVKFDGYKSRLITYDDLVVNLGYQIISSCGGVSLEYSSDTPEEVYNTGYRYWSMSPVEDDASRVYVVQEHVDSANVYGSYAVRPVVNLNKCSLENGCEKQEYDLEVCEDEPTKPAVVPVGNTFKSPIFIMSLISGILVICGVVIFIFNYRKSFKEKNKN